MQSPLSAADRTFTLVFSLKEHCDAISLDVDVDSLYLAQALVDVGPTRKWQRPRPRGMSARILKRTSHITIVLSEKLKSSAIKEKR